MDKKIRISIMVGELRLPLWISPEEEPIFRKAGRRLNSTLNEYRRIYRNTGRTQEDLLSMALLDFAVLLQRKEQDTDPEETGKKLEGILSDLQLFLDGTPSTES